MQQRYYDPQLGVLLSVDPVTAYDKGDMRFFNRYAYAFNNPYRFTDPDRNAPVVPLAIAAGRCATNSGCRAAVAGGARQAGRGAQRAMRWVGAAAMGSLITREGMRQYNESAENSDSASRPTGGEIKIDDKIAGQLGERGWTEDGVRELTNTEPSGASVDNTGGRNDPATVYGTKDGGYVVVNDKTGDVVQVSDKTTDWNPDPRIEWRDDK